MSFFIRILCLAILAAGAGLIYMGTRSGEGDAMPETFSVSLSSSKKLGSDLNEKGSARFQEQHLLREAAFYENMLRRTPESPVLKEQLALLYSHLADLSRLLGETEKEKAHRRRAFSLQSK